MLRLSDIGSFEMVLEGITCEDVDWINLTETRTRCVVVGNTVIEPYDHYII
jgi:hypothetical protein